MKALATFVAQAALSALQLALVGFLLFLTLAVAVAILARCTDYVGVVILQPTVPPTPTPIPPQTGVPL